MNMLYNPTFVSMNPIGDHDQLVTFDMEPTLLGRLLFRKPYQKQYRGSGTVWCTYPSGYRAGTFEESWLSNIYTCESWKKDV